MFNNFQDVIFLFISKISISRPADSRSRLNLFSEIFSVIVGISGALIDQTWVKRERESRGLDIPI